MFQSPSDVAFEVFGFSVYWYGIIMAFAVLFGFCICSHLYKKFYGDNKIIWDISPVLIIVGIIGARLYYCLINFNYYVNHPLEIFDIRQGGLSIHGMIILGIVALYFLAKKTKVSFLKLSDIFVVGVILAQSVGRWGNFFNSEAFGYPTSLPWKIFIPIQNRPLEYIDFEYFHPTFLYESLLNFILFLILFCGFKKMFNQKGMITSVYLVGYSLIRIFVESFRIDSVLNIIGVPIAHLVSLILLLFGVFGIIYVKNIKL